VVRKPSVGVGKGWRIDFGETGRGMNIMGMSISAGRGYRWGR
jgi:hypothetical protein